MGLGRSRSPGCCRNRCGVSRKHRRRKDPPRPSAGTSPGPPQDRPTAARRANPFSSSTLAELYLKQGLVERAADVYRQLLAKEPGNDRARSRLAEIERAPSPAVDRAARRRALERTIAGLEALLAVVQGR
jgi:hypothetical protein